MLVVGFAVTAHNHAGYSVLVGTRRIGPTVWRYSLPQAILKLVLSIWLVGRLGILGVALGTMIPAVVLEYVWLRFVLRELDLPWGVFFRQVVLPTAGPGVSWRFSRSAFGSWYFHPLSGLLPVVAGGCCLTYAALFWFGSLTRAERAELLAHIPFRGQWAAVTREGA